jgi:pimeloyl-ACP methyl ester carboxylesterase
MELDLNRPVLSGWSYGGLIICDYLQAYGEDSIAGTNLVGAVTKIGSEAAMALIGSELRDLVPGFFSYDVEESTSTLQQFLRLCVYAEPAPEDLYFFLGYNVIVPPYVRQGLFSRIRSHDHLLPQIRKPVLITHGQEDAIVLPAAAEQHAAAIKHAQLSLYPQVGHAPFWEAPERFNRELRTFVEAL